MKNTLNKLKQYLNAIGIHPLLTLRALRKTPSYMRDLRRFKTCLNCSPEWPLGKLRPCLTDIDDDAGCVKGDYFHQDLFVAQQIFERNPRHHIDVGSRVDGFVAHIASFRNIEVFDIRPLTSTVARIQFSQADLMKEIPVEKRGSCDSLSCLHTLEHFGLGRYGDSIDPNGYKTGFFNLLQLLQSGGILYFSVPIGPQRIEFNAHRVFSIQHLLDLFQKHSLEVLRFSYVNDGGNLIVDAPLSQELIQNNGDVEYGCGIFELKKTT